MVHSPLLRLLEYLFKVNGGLSEIIFLVKVASLGNSEAKLKVRGRKDLVLDHLKFDDDCEFREFEVGHFNGFLLVDDKLDEGFGWAVLW